MEYSSTGIIQKARLLPPFAGDWHTLFYPYLWGKCIGTWTIIALLTL